MQIAAFDAIPTDDIYDKIANAENFGDPINSNFETVGLEQLLLLPNFGSLGVVILVYPFLYITYYMLGFCDACKSCRKKRKALGKQLFWGALIRLIIESLPIGILCCAVNLTEMNFDPKGDNFVFANAVMTVFFTSVFVIFPIAAI